MESLTIKDPKKVEQGKRLAEHNRQKRAEFKRLKEQSTIIDSTVQVQEKSSFLPVLLTLTVVAGLGTYFYFKHTKKKQPSSNKPKILSHLEKI